MRRVQLAEARFLEAAGKSAMPVIRLALGLAARHAQLRRVHDDDVIAGVDMRRVLRLVLAAQAGSNLDGEPAQDLALGVDHEPALFDLAYLRGIGFHAGITKNAEKPRILHKKTAQTA